jgi:hypothetical protein
LSAPQTSADGQSEQFQPYSDHWGLAGRVELLSTATMSSSVVVKAVAIIGENVNGRIQIELFER